MFRHLGKQPTALYPPTSKLRGLSIALVGLPGSGKSTVARQLARRLQLPWHDSDQQVEAHIGCKIKELFELSGEKVFRDYEEAAIEQLTQDRGVLSTGGGAVLSGANREHLRHRCSVVYLHATPEEIFRRLRHDTQRPLLQVEDPLQKLCELYTDRDPLYREVADFVIETGRPSVATLVNMIAMHLEMAGSRSDTKI